MFKEFREFAFKGNVLDLAVGVSIGSAFSGLVRSLVNQMIVPFFTRTLGGKLISPIGLSPLMAKLTRRWTPLAVPTHRLSPTARSPPTFLIQCCWLPFSTFFWSSRPTIFA